jgi:hypothetical protein
MNKSSIVSRSNLQAWCHVGEIFPVLAVVKKKHPPIPESNEQTICLGTGIASIAQELVTLSREGIAECV